MTDAARTAGMGIGVMLLAAAASLGAVGLSSGMGAWREALAGWVVAVLNALVALAINRLSVRPHGMQSVPLKGLFLNSLRVFVLLGTIVAVGRWMGKESFRVFLMAMFAGYFVCLAAEVLRLHKSILGSSTKHE